MPLYNLLILLGGLAVFLYGMSLMSEGLERYSGGKLKHILERLSANPVKGILLGAGATALIQSSSSTTVMVVGFVNSGLMQLSQAVSIIMGANIGTTITAWLLSTTGLESSSPLLQMLTPACIAPLLAVIGIVLYKAAKNGRKRDIGSVLLGFAILLFSIAAMAWAVQPLAQVPAFLRVMEILSNPLLGLLAGLLLTVILQSSSVSVGLLQAFTATGCITFATAIPVVLGQNIGSCITALLSSIGANKNAKRAAMVHLYFNVIGAAVLMVLFYGLNAFLDFSFVSDHVNAAGVALIHTSFNLLSTLILCPFSGLLEKLACLTVRDAEREEDEPLLDERLLATPAVALDQCRTTTKVMADLSRDTLDLALSMIGHYNKKEADTILQWEQQVDEYEDAIGTYLVKLSGYSLSLSDTHEVSRLLHCIGDFERISDHAVNMMKTSREIDEKQISFSAEAQQDLLHMYRAVRQIVRMAVEAFHKKDLALAAQVEPLEQVVDLLKKQLKSRHIERLQRGECTTEMGFIFSDIITDCERVADHCSNIAVCLIQVHQDSFETHEYLNSLKNSDDKAFRTLYETYKEEYALP